MESVVRVEDEIRSQRSKNLREWKQIVEILLSEGICQFTLATQPERVRVWLGIRVKQEAWLSASGESGSRGVVPSVLSEQEVAYLFEIEAPQDMTASIDLLIPFYEASTVMKRLVHPNYINLTSEDNNRRLRESFDRMLHLLDRRKVSPVLARAIACVMIVKDGLELMLRIMRLSANLDNGLKGRISHIVQLLLEFHFEYSAEPIEREVRGRVIHFTELRAKTAATPKPAQGQAPERQTITNWVRMMVTDPKLSYRAKATFQLLRWAQENEGLSEQDAEELSRSRGLSQQPDDPLVRKRSSLLLTEGVVEVLLERLRIQSYYGRHENHPTIRATLVRMLFHILHKGGDKGKAIFRKLEGIQAFRVLLKGRSGSLRRHKLPPGREMEEFDLDMPFVYLNILDRTYHEDFFAAPLRDVVSERERAALSMGQEPPSAYSSESEGEPSDPSGSRSGDRAGTPSSAGGGGAAGRRGGGAGSGGGGKPGGRPVSAAISLKPTSSSPTPQQQQQQGSRGSPSSPQPPSSVDPMQSLPESKEDSEAVVDVLRQLMREEVWGPVSLGQEMLHCVDILETLVNVEPLPLDLINCCLSHQMIGEHLGELIKQEGENAMIHWSGFVDPLAAHMGAMFAAIQGPPDTLNAIKAEWSPVLGRNSVLHLIGYARHKADYEAAEAAAGTSSTEVTERKLMTVLLAKALPIEGQHVIQVVSYAHQLLQQFLVICGCRSYRASFLNEVAQAAAGNPSPNLPPGWQYGPSSSFDMYPSNTLVFTTPKFYLSSEVSPFMSDHAIGAATKDEEAQAVLLRFRLLCVWRVLQLVSVRFRLAGFTTFLMKRIEAVISVTEASVRSELREADQQPSLFSAVENGRPAWFVNVRLTQFPFRPSFRITYPNHTLPALTRSLAEVLRLVERLAPRDPTSSQQGSQQQQQQQAQQQPSVQQMSPALRKANADRFCSVVGFALYELCVFEPSSLTVELGVDALERRLGVTAAEMQVIHRITEEESFRVVPVKIGGDAATTCRVFHITEDPAHPLPEVYFILALNATWYMYASCPNQTKPLVNPAGVDWATFARGSQGRFNAVTGSSPSTNELPDPRKKVTTASGLSSIPGKREASISRLPPIGGGGGGGGGGGARPVRAEIFDEA